MGYLILQFCCPFEVHFEAPVGAIHRQMEGLTVLKSRVTDPQQTLQKSTELLSLSWFQLSTLFLGPKYRAVILSFVVL